MLREISELLFILGYGFGDTITTYQIYNHNDLHECNPIVNIILKYFGFIGFIFAKILIIGYIITYCEGSLWPLVLIGFIVAAWNLIQIHKANRN